MKKFILLLAVLYSISAVACSCLPYLSFCETKSQFPHDITFYGKIISSNSMNIKMIKYDVVEGNEQRDTITIWNDTIIPTCDSMLARDLGKVGDTLLILLNRIQSKKNSWDVIGDYTKPENFCTQAVLKVNNDTLRGLINQINFFNPTAYEGYSDFKVDDIIFFLKSNRGDCTPLRDTTFDYIPFPITSASWVDSINDASYSRCLEIQTTILKDTIIQGRIYQKYHRHEQERFMCGTNSNVVDSTFGYVRNDIPNKKVWLRLSGKSKDTLLYDFNVTKGDLLPYTFLMYNPPNSVGRIIDSIRFEYIGNRYRRVYYYTATCGPNPFQKHKLIEGIGDSNGAFINNSNCFLAMPSSSLGCFSISNKKMFPDTIGQCDIVTALNEEISLEFELFPNPTKDGVLFFSKRKVVKRVDIYNIKGQLLSMLSGNLNQVQLPEYTGLYFLRIYFVDGTILTKKIARE